MSDEVSPSPDPGYAGTRVSYRAGRLDESSLAATPLAQFERWYAQAIQAGVAEPNAMVLATCDVAGVPGSRTVLLKQADARGFVFYTNYASRKAAELEATGAAALTFPWYGLQRQVGVRGRVERVPRSESAAYFALRPWGSRIGAWASRQSAALVSRQELQARYDELATRWPDRGGPDDVPLPPHWGGYLVRAVEVEFWQGRPSRLHDRLVFLDAGQGGAPVPLDDPASWHVLRRQP